MEHIADFYYRVIVLTALLEYLQASDLAKTAALTISQTLKMVHNRGQLELTMLGGTFYLGVHVVSMTE